MRQKIFTLLLISATALVSCRKNNVDVDIKTYDDAQIKNYINAHGLTGMKRDLDEGDTTGIYYQLLLPGKIVPPATALQPLDFPDVVSFVFTLRTLDGKYVSSDTIHNHVEGLVGHLTQSALPYGLELAIRNILKYKGASARLLIPSRLAYGAAGYRTAGSSTVVNANIAGNESLDYYVHIIDDYKTYDEQVIKNTVSDISTYTKKESTTKPGYFYYYKILEPGTGATPVTLKSTITATYTGQLVNGDIFDGANNGTNVSQPLPIATLVTGVQEAFLQNVVVGTKIAMVIPSDLGYGDTSQGSIPTNSVLKFTFIVVSVTN